MAATQTASISPPFVAHQNLREVIFNYHNRLSGDRLASGIDLGRQYQILMHMTCSLLLLRCQAYPEEARWRPAQLFKQGNSLVLGRDGNGSPQLVGNWTLYSLQSSFRMTLSSAAYNSLAREMFTSNLGNLLSFAADLGPNI